MANQKERQCLSGLPWLPRLVYHESIKSRMDYKTGMVGDQPGRRISWQAISEDLEVQSAPGIAYQRPTRRKLERAVEHLIKRELVSRLSNHQYLIFKCHQVNVTQNVHKKVVTKWCGESVTGETNPTPTAASEIARLHNRSGEAVNVDSGDTSIIGNISECVFTLENALKIFDFYVTGKFFSYKSFENYVKDYFSFCKRKGSTPNEEGLANLLEAKHIFIIERNDNIRSARELYIARRMKQKAIAIREEDIADIIHSNNIFFRQKHY
ncbi:MAG: hypothetical protein LPD71_00045 [Shewanella sp.]|nr:hypothetical protein [Shewanella sp.]MCF1437192.1 hypothetical protein [Shewanella sp.]MCF1459494.1 hypothetical protein [Shewanella sp.]